MVGVLQQAREQSIGERRSNERRSERRSRNVSDCMNDALFFGKSENGNGIQKFDELLNER